MANKTGDAGKWMSEGGRGNCDEVCFSLVVGERRGYFSTSNWRKPSTILLSVFIFSRAGSLFNSGLTFGERGDLNIICLVVH